MRIPVSGAPKFIGSTVTDKLIGRGDRRRGQARGHRPSRGQGGGPPELRGAGALRLHEPDRHALGEALGKVPEIRKFPEQAGDVRMTCADISLARVEFGYAPATAFEQGIGRFVEWSRSGAAT